MTPSPKRGEIWRADLDPVRGHEQGRIRPVLVVSTDIFNRGSTDLVTIVPITSRAQPIRTFLRVDPPEGGLSQISYLICDQIRTIAKERLGKRLGVISNATIGEVERRLKFLLDLR